VRLSRLAREQVMNHSVDAFAGNAQGDATAGAPGGERRKARMQGDPLVEEAGDRDPAGARLGAILQVLLAREPSRPAPLIRAWWPRLMPVPPQLRLTNRIPARDIFMLRPIENVRIPDRADDVFYWRSDYF